MISLCLQIDPYWLYNWQILNSLVNSLLAVL